MPHLGHVHLKVSDVDRSVAFYTDVFELAVPLGHRQPENVGVEGDAAVDVAHLQVDVAEVWHTGAI